MQFLDRDEVAKFLSVQSTSKVELEMLRGQLKDDDLYFNWPNETGKVLAAIRSIVHFKEKADWTLVIIENAGIWPSWEDRNLYDLLRKAKGGQTQWSYGEGHLFTSKEEQDLITFMSVFSNFRWDFRLMDSNDDFHMFASHDDYVIIRARSIANNLWASWEQIDKKARS